MLHLQKPPAKQTFLHITVAKFWSWKNLCCYNFTPCVGCFNISQIPFIRFKFDLVYYMLKLNNVSAAVEADKQKKQNLFSDTVFKCAAQ